MNATEVAQNNFNSWNRHDAGAIVTAYATGGTYRSPRLGHPLIGKAIGDFAKQDPVTRNAFFIDIEDDEASTCSVAHDV